NTFPHQKEFPQNGPESLDSRFLEEYPRPLYLKPIHPLNVEQSPFGFQNSATLPYTSHPLPDAQSTIAYWPILAKPLYFVPLKFVSPFEVWLLFSSILL